MSGSEPPLGAPRAVARVVPLSLRRGEKPLGIVLLLGVALGGCVVEKEDRRKLDLGVEPGADPMATSAAFRDTIGALTYYEGLGVMRVRGYGLVVGLGTNGSSECPKPACDRLIESLYKQYRFSSSVVGVRGVTPEQMIRDLDTAVVLIQGEIPPGAVKGSHFDVAVAALPGTQTKSLRGGRLYTADLHVYRPVSQAAAITGQTLATASGPLFSNPFSQGQAATSTNPLEGIIIGGGTVAADRRVQLVLGQASYRRAGQIRDRINAQFSGAHKVADAVSPSYVRLQIPPEYNDDIAHFLALVRALYLSRDPQFEAARAQALTEEITKPDAPHAQIALALEGLGRSAAPVIDALYPHPLDYVSFHAAAAGMRLGDHVACDAMILHARNTNGQYRYPAIRALGQAREMAGAAMALRALLDDEDPRIQVAAYEALIKRNDSAIQSTTVAEDNFILDRIDSRRPNMIYAKRSGARRIALFGRDLKCRPPLLYRAPDGSVTINADSDDEKLTVLRVVVASGSMSPPVPAPLELPALIQLLGSDAGVSLNGTVTGLGLDYAALVHALYDLSHDKSVNADFVLEQPNVVEILGPPRPPGRPESEP